MSEIGVLGIAGSQEVQARLWKHLQSDRLHPAFIFSCNDKILLSRLAKQLAKVLLCRSHPSSLPFCAHCSICRRIDNDRYTDVLWVSEAEEDSLKVEKVRSVCHEMEIGPVEGNYKICVIEDAHRLTTSSSNAFLKTLEEPLPGRIFWLLTPQPASLLPTIQSRCLSFSLGPKATQETQTKHFTSENWMKAFDKLETKAEYLEWLHFLEQNLREKVGSHLTGDHLPTSNLVKQMSVEDCFECFEEVMVLEGRLRSNANFGLLVDPFLRRWWKS